jgi:hypothetical protein
MTRQRSIVHPMNDTIGTGVATRTGPTILVSMGTGQNRVSLGLRRFWRRLVSAAAIYALVMQPLLLSVVGTQFANAAALDDFSLSQLCLHATDGSPVAPADQQKHPARNHCLLCFAGAFHLLDAPRPVTVASVSRKFWKVRQSAHPLRLSSFSRYSVARPRGPPPSA